MRQYLRVAVIEVSEESLRLLAGDEVLGQAAGLVDGGMVADVRLDGLLVFATIAGTPVSVRVLEDALAWKCPCSSDAPCVHVVAAVVAWVRTGTDEETPDLLAVLQEQSTAWLALRLAAIADGNAELTRLLLADPVALADRLVSARLNTGWDVFVDGPAKYADVLGPAGLARCAERLEQQKGKKSHGLAELRESLARAQAALTAAES